MITDILPLVKSGYANIISYTSSFEGRSFVETILFRPNAQRNALLLAISELQDVDLAYLKGLLLGYPEGDIEFFLQRRTFLEGPPLHLSEQDRHRLEQLFNVVPYGKWTKDDHDLFNDFLTQSNASAMINKEKEKSLNWIAQYNRYSNEQLNDLFMQLKNK